MYSGSMQRQPRRQQDINVRRSKSNVGNMKINEDEVLASYANIDSPTQLHESDSAFGSGIDDDDEVCLSMERIFICLLVRLAFQPMIAFLSFLYPFYLKTYLKELCYKYFLKDFRKFYFSVNFLHS